LLFFFSSRRRHTRSDRDWSSDVCSSDLDDLVERVFGVDEVKAFKPDPRPYRLVLDELGDATLVAAHAWDVVGASRAGLRAVWVRSEERRVGEGGGVGGGGGL